MPFCDTMDSIDQPDKYRKQECPPEKGFGLIMMSAWVWPMFLVPVSLYSGCKIAWNVLTIGTDREITISSLMR